MISLDVNLGERSYPILIGSGLLGDEQIMAPYTGGRDVLIITNNQVGPIYSQPLGRMLGAARLEQLELEDGEATKTVETLARIWDRLVELRFGRDCVLVTLGGGVVGDVGGFAAATWHRGVNFIQVPTTLLAQVDSAVGGKTAVNLSGGKNLVGSFHQPRLVLSDTDTLQTLPDRELSAGLAEVVKYGLIEDAELFAWLEDQVEPLLRRDPAGLRHAIRRSCEIKASIVGRDEREQGQRALLNLGHTFGHAIERCKGYGEWLHGEAVAAGMVMAANFSRRMGWMQEGDIQRIRRLLDRFNLPADPPPLDPREFLAAMSMDKKVAAGQIRLVLLREIGDARLVEDFPNHELLDMLREQFIR